MTTDINKLLERLRTYYGDDLACRMLLMDARHALEAMAGEVAEALPWKLFYRDGLDLEQIGKRLGKSPYDFSPWLYAPLISQLKDREKTALADLAAERDRLKAALDIAKAHAKQNQRARDLVSPYPNDHAKRIVWEKALYHEGKDLWDKLRKALGGDAS